jgi:hypothetical protein
LGKGGQLKIAPTIGVEKVEAFALQLMTHGGIGVVIAEHGLGKSTAVSLAKAKLEARADRPRLVMVDCVRDGNAGMLARALAKSMDLTIPGNMNPVAYFPTIKSKLLIRGVSLIIVDNVDHLDAGCREHLLRLIDTVLNDAPNKIGLLVTETPSDEGSFTVDASNFGYRPYHLQMPTLSADEVVGFLASTFPDIADDLASQLASPTVLALIADLLAQSGGRPRTLNDLFTSIQLGLSKLKLADIKAAICKLPATPLQLSVPRRRTGLKKSPH